LIQLIRLACSELAGPHLDIGMYLSHLCQMMQVDGWLQDRVFILGVILREQLVR
jgi:hypothetical protein